MPWAIMKWISQESGETPTLKHLFVQIMFIHLHLYIHTYSVCVHVQCNSISMTSNPYTFSSLHHWISCFRILMYITPKRGTQFTLQLWSAIVQLLGTRLHHSTAYHPQSNGLVERFHRRLKSSQQWLGKVLLSQIQVFKGAASSPPLPQAENVREGKRQTNREWEREGRDDAYWHTV